MSEHDDFASSLVRAGKRERMPTARRDALVASLGAGAGIAGAASVAKIAAPAKSTASALVAKWLAVGIATTTLAVGAVTGASHYLAAPPPPPAPVVTSLPTPVVPPPIATVEQSAPAPTELEPPRSAPRPTAKPAEPEPEPTPTPAARSVADEARVVERARTALAQDDTAAATAALDEHDRVYPRGAFADEARVVRIDLLARSDRAAARTEAAAFLASHPGTPYATHLRNLAER